MSLATLVLKETGLLPDLVTMILEYTLIKWKDDMYNGYVPQKGGKLVDRKTFLSRAYIGCIWTEKSNDVLCAKQIQKYMHTLDGVPIVPNGFMHSLEESSMEKHHQPWGRITEQWFDAKTQQWSIMFRLENTNQGFIMCQKIEQMGLKGLGICWECFPDDRIGFESVILCNKGALPGTGIAYAVDLNSSLK